jgi:SAM-dependent methyltransferase
MLRPHSTEWYQRLSTLHQGFIYPWQSELAGGNGEEAYLTLVEQHTGPNVDLLDVACGHGALTLHFARQCRSIFGYDLIPSYIEMAQAAAKEQGITNARFVAYDSSFAANGGVAHIPADDNVFDLLVSSKGPFHWVEDARRVARPGATMLMLIPDTTPMPAWHDLLPPSLQWSSGTDPNWARSSMEGRLAKSGFALHSWWSFDVPEHFTDPHELYHRLTWGHTVDEVPGYADIADDLAALYATYNTGHGLTLRHRRHLWKAVVEK